MNDDRLACVLRICEEAIGREGAERSAYLDDACGADADLRGEVDALLARQDDSRDGFLTTPPWQRDEPTLSAGQRLGPYEITGSLGAGGMGAVYKARDTRLERTVAIKVIPCDGGMDVSVRERFTREARAIAAINHPNICAIYDIGRERASSDGSLLDFMVIEYLEGCTLAQQLAAGALAPQDAVRVGIQIADALAAAHQQGIVHGDLKPANIMLSRSPAGLVAKLLDFGLAELTPATHVAVAAGNGRAPAPAATPPRSVHGTLPYIAPERFQGGKSDARSDLFAFGCVLYEMLAGSRAFGGDTESAMVSAILTREPPSPGSLEPSIPAALDRLVRRCLAKDPDDRRETARAVADELRRIAEPFGVAGASRWLAARWLWAGMMAVAVVTGAVVWGAWRAGPHALVQPKVLVLSAPDRVGFGNAQSVEFSSDGRAVIYFGVHQGVSALYWQDLNEPDGHVISGTESTGQQFLTPFVSPDGSRLGFVRAGRLVVAPMHSGRIAKDGPATVLADGVQAVRGVSWGDGGTLVYCPNAYAGLWRVSANGGPPRELTIPDRARYELSHAWPQVLPGGRAALFTIRHASGRQDRSVIAVVELDTGRVRRLVEGGSYGRYAPSGHVVYARNGALFAVPFDLASLRVTGRSVQLLTGVAMESAGSGSARFAISGRGALVYEPAPPRPNAKNSLIWVDRDGRVEPIAPERRAYQTSLDLSPDGRKIAVRIEDATRLDSQIWTYDVSRRRWQQLTFEGDNAAPLFSPAGDRIAFSSNRDGAFNLYVMAAEGGRVERLTRSPYWQYPSSWSPDARWLIYSQQNEPTLGNPMWMLSMTDHDSRRWGPENGNTFGAKFSPDGRWIAYQSQQADRVDVYVRPFPGSGPDVRVPATGGGMAPFWSRDGRTIFYVDGSEVMSARVHPGVPPRVSAPHLAFALPFAPTIAGSTNVLALTPDARRVALVQVDPERAPRAERLLVVPDFGEELTTRVPRTR